MTKEIILKKLKENKSLLRELGVKKLTLFGSYAIDEQTKNSDIDFLIEFENNRGLFKDVIKLKLLLENLFLKEVDVVKKHLIREELKQSILEDKQYEAEI